MPAEPHQTSGRTHPRARLFNGKPPIIFEDGRQKRDFVHASDVAQAYGLALENGAAIGQAFNVGSDQTLSVTQVADQLSVTLGLRIEPEITGECRVGDVRHCFPDLKGA